MRMRRKKHLDERLAACSENLISPVLRELNFKKAAVAEPQLDFKELFGNEAPVFLEIGCGKGLFARETALRHPENNYLAVEKIANVIVTAAEEAEKLKLKNLKFLQLGAEYLETEIPPSSISGIFLNFSCPYPKNSYESHRLTSDAFLKIYKKLLKPGAEIHQKTDNMKFFEYSIEKLSGQGFILKNISLDLHKSDFSDNIITEYENKFAEQGLPIYRLEAAAPKEDSP